MSGAGRRLQRRGQGSRVREALAQAQQAVAALQGTQLERLPGALRDLEAQTTRASRLADALAEDYETLAEELEIQREVTLHLCNRIGSNPGGVDGWRKIEAGIRQQVKDEREQGHAESATTKQA